MVDDNQHVDSAASYDVATDKVTYSGNADQNVELIRQVHVEGSEGSKTVTELTTPEGVKVVLTDPNTDLPVVVDENQQLQIGLGSAIPAGTAHIGEVAAVGVVAHDTPASGNPVRVGGYAKTTAPTDVSSDGDAVNAWYTTYGAQVAALSVGTGALVTGDATNGLDVDVTRLPALVAGTANIGDVDVASIAAGDNNIGNVDVVTLPALVAGSANIGDVDVLTLPADPLGANADAIVAAGAVGSISAKLRRTTQGIEDLKTGIILAAGSAAIGKLAANSGIDIGDVDVLSVPSPLSTAGAGTAAAAHRVTLASDDPGVTALQIMDDWDESDRAKVNPIAGQAGVAAGSGASSALTQRIVLATDTTVPNVSGDVAHGTADSGNPVKIGLRAVNAFPTAESNNDRVNGISDLFGRMLTSHIDPAQQVFKSYNDTASRAAASAQVVWDPTSGKRIAITSYVISAYGTTAGRIFLFFADDADLTYSAGSDQPLLVASYAPSTSAKPGTVWTGAVPIFCLTADRRLHYQNDAAISIDITIYGYEW